MSGLFPKAPKALPPPKPVRMPVETDPEVLAAAQRTRSNALQRQGRLSTMLTDATSSVSGGGSQKLGA